MVTILSEWRRGAECTGDRKSAALRRAEAFAGWIAGAVLVMMFTGPLVWFTGLLPSVSRTRAIFVYDFLALAIVGVRAGHVRKAYQDPETAPGMRTGFASRSWAKRHHPRWVNELDEPRRIRRGGRRSRTPTRTALPPPPARSAAGIAHWRRRHASHHAGWNQDNDAAGMASSMGPTRSSGTFRVAASGWAGGAPRQ